MSDDYTALQKALAAEHAVIWGFGEIGAHVDGDLLAQVSDADLAHRERRNTIEQWLVGQDLDPVASEPAYSLPAPLTDAASALELAAQLEDAMVAQWRYCLGHFDSEDLRAALLQFLVEGTLAAYTWRRQVYGVNAPTQAFPGE